MTLHLRMNDDPHQIEYDTRDGEIARRNVLFGLWAGQRMGLKGDAIEDYAWSVHLADRDSPGHDDVIAKVAIDLASCGRPISDRQLRSYLQEMAMRASLDLAQTYPEAIMSGRR
ncbi:ATPase inhibitor subunit zeta [Bradyrhizobium sp.]|uniref:ATPase inhibitor subunit zeta n=1 Tax=Bradyrhizobium sp. TaxID=376 RepID=UPI0025C0F8AD|nr:ATPase inhibitor subunit zeta [Bradyrhizobium sp.]